MMDTQPFLPLTEPVFFILLSLVHRPQHGYAIMKETAVASDGRVQLSTSTLYSAIKRLLEQGLIERVSAESGAANGRERKAYQLTEQGRRLLNAEINRLQSLVAAATRVSPRPESA